MDYEIGNIISEVSSNGDMVHLDFGGKIPDDAKEIIVFNELSSNEKIVLLLEMLLLSIGSSIDKNNVYLNSHNIDIIGLKGKIKKVGQHEE